MAAAATVLLLVGVIDAHGNDASITAWGKELFTQRCAPCHGADGRGAGPAAAALKTGPADLTQISRAHGGTFPFFWVVAFIDGERPVPAHGSRDMPVWGREFRWSTGEYGARAQIHALTRYLESIQEK